MINDNFIYEDKNEAITTWRSYMQSMGLGGPIHIDIKGEEGGLLAGADYLNRRYKGKWDGKTIWWAGMGQGDITVTPLQALQSCSDDSQPWLVLRSTYP